MYLAQQTIECKDVTFSWRTDRVPVAIEAEGHIFHNVNALLEAYPFLNEPAHLEAFVPMVNFLFSENLYNYISDPEGFRSKYRERMTKQSEIHAAIPNMPLFGPFVVDEISRPRIEDRYLIFYVHDAFHNIPYKARCPYPCKANAIIQYELLTVDDDSSTKAG